MYILTIYLLIRLKFEYLALIYKVSPVNYPTGPGVERAGRKFRQGPSQIENQQKSRCTPFASENLTCDSSEHSEYV